MRKEGTFSVVGVASIYCMLDSRVYETVVLSSFAMQLVLLGWSGIGAAK